jgi:hypothetical protein
MILKLKIGWPGTAKRQTVVSQRLASDPYGNNGFYVASQGNSLIIGAGQIGSNEVLIHNSMPAEAWLEIDKFGIAWKWSEDPSDIIGLMFFTPLGDTLYEGEDPQMPGARFEGSVEIVGDDNIIGDNWVPQNNPIDG